MINYKLIGTRIRSARTEKGITQERLAETLGISPEYCSKVETGKAKANLERLSQISVALDIELEFLICGVVHESNSYLSSEIKEALSNCSGVKMDAIIKVIEIISKL